jgi:acyl-coenzyme A synthetase/AMP-(fatty) acid ligase
VVEGGLESHPAVTKAAVLVFPYDVKGEAIYAFVTLYFISDFYETTIRNFSNI